MPKAYWVICHRSTKSAEKFAAFTRLAYPAIQAAGGRFLVRTSTVAKTHEHGLNDRTVVIEFENLAKAIAAYDNPDYKQAYRAVGDGGERDRGCVTGV